MPPGDVRIISWNLLRRVGASADEVTELVQRERPDLLLMQEATAEMDALPRRVGGHYSRCLLPGRSHGLAAWSAGPFHAAPIVLTLPAGSVVRRVAQIVDVGGMVVANVHLSHGQMLNRRQLRWIARFLPPHAAVLGDFNMVGAPLLPGFADVGPRRATHAAGTIVPLRLDRCLVRGLRCRQSSVLPRGTSDHRPILVVLQPGMLQPGTLQSGTLQSGTLQPVALQSGVPRSGLEPAVGAHRGTLTSRSPGL